MAEVTVVEDVITVELGAAQGPPGPVGPTGSAGAQNYTKTAAQALSGHRLVRATGADTVDYADSSNLAHMNSLLGVTQGAVSSGNPITVQQTGEMTEPSWSWTPGSPIFLNGVGVLSQTPPTVGYLVRVGFAESPTKMVVYLSQPVVLA